MRTGFHGSVITNSDGEIYGIDLGADYCAEHEWGISTLQRILDIDDSQRGILGYSSSWKKTPEERAPYIFSGTNKGVFYLVFQENAAHWHTSKKFIIPRSLGWVGVDDGLCGAWSDCDFGIAVNKKQNPAAFAFVKKLETALRTNQISIWFNATANPFGRSGLIVAITEMVPVQVNMAMIASQADRDALNSAVEATGVMRHFSSQPSRFYALRPKWITDDESMRESKMVERKTAHPVIFWLNPAAPQHSNHGWFTAEELVNWATGTENPIDKKNR